MEEGDFTQPISDPEEIRLLVKEAYGMAGHLLDDLQDTALLVDALCLDCPIVGATAGFCKLTGYSLEHLLGQNCRMMLEGVPQVAISRSARRNLQDYCETCCVKGLHSLGNVSAVQPNSRADGSTFVNFFMLGLCRVQGRTFILGVQTKIGDGLYVKLSQPEMSRVTEATLDTYKRIREHIWSGCKKVDGLTQTSGDAESDVAPVYLRQAFVAQPDFAFFAERLQDHCLIINNGFTAIRREAEDLAFNCLVFGDRPVRRTRAGLRFTVHVDKVTPTFNGLPVLGFTKRKPTDFPELYPSVNKCLGSSVLIGACGEAFVRDKSEHFKMGFKSPPNDEVQTWALQVGLPPHRRSPPVCIASGDLLHCIYSWDGHLQLVQNDEVILDFDVERPVDRNAAYYAVVDVCFSAYSLTIMPSEKNEAGQEPGKDSGGFPNQVSGQSDESNTCMSVGTAVSTGVYTDVDVGVLSSLVNDVIVTNSILAAIADCKFMVTIADPGTADCPLIAVSQEFETMTGFTRGEILGVNCRFLNQGCEMDPADLASLRSSSLTGEPFTAVITNRKKSGELFLNLLDLRGLTVARHPETNEDLWYLVGIQADVTDLADDEIPLDHIADLQFVADSIRMRIAKEVSRMAVAGAFSADGESAAAFSNDTWQLLSEPQWRPGSTLGARQPTDSLVADVAPSMRLKDPLLQNLLPEGQCPVAEPSERPSEPSKLAAEPCKPGGTCEASSTWSRTLLAVGGTAILGTSLLLLLLQSRRSKR